MTARSRIAIAIAIALWAVLACPLPAAFAANGQERQGQVDAKPIASGELESFAVAAREVFRIRQAFAPKVQAAQSEIDARDFIVAAQSAMEDAIRDAGLSVARYNQILRAAQRDASLASRIQVLVDKAAQKK